MTSKTMMSTSEKLTTLTRRDLAVFDKVATDLIFEMQAEGWQGYITNRNHAMMRHPDGSHQSISRDSSRASSGTAMRARFESWKRRRAEREAHPVFELPEEDQPRSFPFPIATGAEMRRHEALAPYVTDPNSTIGDDWEVVGYDQDPRAWAVFDVSKAYPLLVAHGSTTNDQGAWAALMVERPDVFPEPVASETTDQESVMASVFVCPEPGCGKQFDQQRKASVHNASAHHREIVKCTAEGCAWTGPKGMLSRHTQGQHESSTHTCGMCGKEFSTNAGLSMHRTRSHRGQVDPPVHVSRLEGYGDGPRLGEGAPDLDDEPRLGEVAGGGATVAPPSGDVLLHHLEHLPEGADAEAMVAAVRSIVAGPLVAEVRRLREELVQVTKERDKFAGESADFEARLTLMREVMGV